MNRWYAVLSAVTTLALPWSVGAIPLDQAQRDRSLTVQLRPHGYTSVTVSVHNRSDHAVQVTALPGTVLDDPDEGEQDLTVTAPMRLDVPAGATVSRTVSTYCLNLHAAPPSEGRVMTARPMLAPLALLLKDARGGHDANTQQRVWTLMDQLRGTVAKAATADCPSGCGGGCDGG
jgi:hypothetical protein